MYQVLKNSGYQVPIPWEAKEKLSGQVLCNFQVLKNMDGEAGYQVTAEGPVHL